MNSNKLLSQREREVVVLLLKGKSNKQMALLLSVSESTIEFHLSNIYTKMHVGSRIELVLELWKTAGGVSSLELGESIVGVGDKSIYDSNQLTKWIKSLKTNGISTQKGEKMKITKVFTVLTLVLSFFVLIGIVLSHLALTDIFHGIEPNRECQENCVNGI
ncbi:MAG: helix-turn-helix transcriptional regulator [Anaerolineae bacterium]|jgi:DNA-binding CsgD family transcriptional regulator|nr:helix-turn-helix transcriptional regulator [Anaerolineae bacterium]MBT7991095.1 helix-turn-helix transcriptional regulator [Anaerolineae bacterium]